MFNCYSICFRFFLTSTHYSNVLLSLLKYLWCFCIACFHFFNKQFNSVIQYLLHLLCILVKPSYPLKFEFEILKLWHYHSFLTSQCFMLLNHAEFTKIISYHLTGISHWIQSPLISMLIHMVWTYTIINAEQVKNETSEQIIKIK